MAETEYTDINAPAKHARLDCLPSSVVAASESNDNSATPATRSSPTSILPKRATTAPRIHRDVVPRRIFVPDDKAKRGLHYEGVSSSSRKAPSIPARSRDLPRRPDTGSDTSRTVSSIIKKRTVSSTSVATGGLLKRRKEDHRPGEQQVGGQEAPQFVRRNDQQEGEQEGESSERMSVWLLDHPKSEIELSPYRRRSDRLVGSPRARTSHNEEQLGGEVDRQELSPYLLRHTDSPSSGAQTQENLHTDSAQELGGEGGQDLQSGNDRLVDSPSSRRARTLEHVLVGGDTEQNDYSLSPYLRRNDRREVDQLAERVDQLVDSPRSSPSSSPRTPPGSSLPLAPPVTPKAPRPDRKMDRIAPSSRGTRRRLHFA